MKKKILFLLIGILGFQLLMLVKMKFTAWPEMLLWPYLMLGNWLPYQDIAIAHTPLLLIKLSLFYKLFGVGVIQLKVFSWILIISTNLLLYFISKKLWGIRTALFTSAAYIFIQLFYDGNGLWFDLFMGLPILAAYYFTYKKNWLFAGLLFGLAVLSKQTAVYFALPIAVALFRDFESWPKNIVRFISGTFAIGGIFILLLWLYGILPDFYSWAVKFGITQLPSARGQVQLPGIKNLLIAAFPFAAFIPFIFSEKKRNLTLALWAFTGTLGAYPRFEFFHFQPSIPFLAMTVGIAAVRGFGIKKYSKLFLAAYLIGSLYLFSNFFVRNFNEGTRFYEADVIRVADYVKTNTNPGDTILVMNWWDSIYALSGTIPATRPWVPQLSWYQEIGGIQEKEILDIKKAQPKIILIQPYSQTGLSAYSPKKVYEYVKTEYQIKEKVGGMEVYIPR